FGPANQAGNNRAPIETKSSYADGFARGTLVHKAHGNPSNATDDFRLARISDLTHLLARSWIGKQNQAIAADFAPTANINLPQFDKINGALKLIPLATLNSLLQGVD